MLNLSRDIEKKAKQITIKIAPKYTFGYEDLFEVVFHYLSDCEKFDEEYSEENLERLIHQHAMEGW